MPRLGAPPLPATSPATAVVTPPPPPPPPPAGPPADDRSVLARVADGDRDALRVLYERHAGWLTVRLQRRCPDPELVDTALQDTFLAVWRGAGGFRGDGDVGAWLWGIAVRRLIDLLRRRRPEPVELPSVSGPDARDAAPSAEHEVLAGQVGGELGEAFGRLTPELQAVLLATAVDGLSTKEAAVLLGVPQGTVKTRLMRARSQIQERFA